MISLRPSITSASSSSEATATRRPMRSTAKVRIWPILTHDCFGRPTALLSSVSGSPARGSRLGHQLIDAVEQVGLKRHGNFRFRHDSDGMINHHTTETMNGTEHAFGNRDQHPTRCVRRFGRRSNPACTRPPQNVRRRVTPSR